MPNYNFIKRILFWSSTIRAINSSKEINVKALLDNHAGMILPVCLVESVVPGQYLPFYI